MLIRPDRAYLRPFPVLTYAAGRSLDGTTILRRDHVLDIFKSTDLDLGTT
jgi:hypothetical protein